MRPILKVPPAQTPISRDEAKADLLLDTSDHDLRIDGLIQGAVSHLDGYKGILGRCMISQQWEIKVSGWMGELVLPFPDVQSVEISYIDPQDVSQVLPGSEYELVEMVPGTMIRFVGDAFPALSDMSEPISITMTAGYGDAPDDVPSDLRVALTMLVHHWFKSPGIVGDERKLPVGFHDLVGKHRMVRL